jgi:hypothetical protein
MATIKAKGPNSDYEKNILVLVDQIKGRPVGQVIVEAIEGTGKQLTIRPESERPAGSFDPKLMYSGSVSLAATFPVDSAGRQNYAAASPASLSRTAPDGPDKWYAGKSDDPDTMNADERYDAALPRWGDPKGGGSDVHLFFTLHKGTDVACKNGSSYCADLDDEILLHEMVHALRYMQGVSNPVPTTARYKNEEEFLAVVITNVYVSKKKGNTLLSPAYRKYGPLQAPLNTTAGFLEDTLEEKENKRILTFYSTHWQPVFGRLGEVDTLFNPFRPFKPTPKQPGK